MRLLMLAGTVLLGAIGAAVPGSAQPRVPAHTIIGFGADARGAPCTFGEARCTCTVTATGDDGAGSLRDCAARPGTLVRFATRGPIMIERPIPLASNVTLDGRAIGPGQRPVVITGPSRVTLMIDDASNIVIRNLSFRGASARAACATPRKPADVIGCGVPILAQGDAHDILIDHNDFTRCGDKCIALWSKATAGGSRAIGADRVTISNNRFSDSYFAILVGASGALGAAQLPAEMRVTIARNVFDDIFRRTPRAASGAKVHLLNNVISDWGRDNACATGEAYGWAVSVTGGAELLAEGNYFAARAGADRCKAAFTIGERTSDDGSERGLGHIARANNLLANGARDEGGRNDRVFTPPYRYAVADPRTLRATLSRTAGVAD